MPRYFYHIRQGGNLHRDTEGTELENAARARLEAVVTLSEIAREEFPRDGDHQDITVEVFDEAGLRILSAAITFRVEEAAAWHRNPAADAGEGS